MRRKEGGGWWYEVGLCRVNGFLTVFVQACQKQCLVLLRNQFQNFPNRDGLT